MEVKDFHCCCSSTILTNFNEVVENSEKRISTDKEDVILFCTRYLLSVVFFVGVAWGAKRGLSTVFPLIG